MNGQNRVEEVCSLNQSRRNRYNETNYIPSKNRLTNENETGKISSILEKFDSKYISNSYFVYCSNIVFFLVIYLFTPYWLIQILMSIFIQVETNTIREKQ